MAILGLCFIDNISKHMYNLCIDKHNLRIVMKERIKQLAIEAKLIAPEYNGFDHTRLSISQQRFAELIVRECIDIAQDRAAFDGFPPNDVNHIIDEIKEHFGVEE